MSTNIEQDCILSLYLECLVFWFLLFPEQKQRTVLGGRGKILKLGDVQCKYQNDVDSGLQTADCRQGLK